MKAGSTTSLAGDFMLAVYLDGQGRVPSYRTGLDFGLSGAMLMELAMGGLIHTVDGHIVAVHAAQPPDRVLGEVLARIESSRRLRTPAQWVRTLSGGAHKRLAAGLITDGVLVRLPRRLPLPTDSGRRYDVLSGERQGAAVRSPRSGADDRSVALTALATACGATSADQDGSEYGAMVRSLSPACAQILAAVAACVWHAGLCSWA
ncbi:GPP34 family phosphoprotein [Streptomyces europaeiscabiei]|uniref:GOLPH3/VPS74 family protein n=1 Tax=Streptomyces TaxID=1883 RepID=UPI000A39C36E|nr:MULTISPECIES: GPP34 family phosphoprotein [Streptomyces]MDX3580646.1 GPP34 family phosphoprotein [Streptomyces europaeiscabiei]MDX3611630.1 GPP34 family phosphoprotein [Streptomyces europaeiscabiei]MDX3630758.1 GPP34 family phosphoprotein [Streptomyces europaeiscabiei]MDX3649228.1 GPP34 family phosphoprotein [Streptomyces europaeiscabiei]WUD37252.1 GPP34 family phosphoprotein [Streptomyces europaeiscabiei]